MKRLIVLALVFMLMVMAFLLLQPHPDIKVSATLKSHSMTWKFGANTGASDPVYGLYFEDEGGNVYKYLIPPQDIDLFFNSPVNDLYTLTINDGKVIKIALLRKYVPSDSA